MPISKVRNPQENSFLTSLSTYFLNKPALLCESYLNNYIQSDLIKKDKWYERETYSVKKGKAVILIAGLLMNEPDEGPWEKWGYISTYSRIRKDYDRALNDPEVEKIYFHFDTGGGDVSGCFDLCDYIYQNRDLKPTTALVDEHCFSGGYALASSCSSIVTPRTGMVGSIGVITMHEDISEYLSDLGINIEIIKAGKQKDSRSPYKPLSDESRVKIQADINETYDLFVSTVARNRGIAEQAVRDTEANVYKSADAISLGLIDQISAIKDFFENGTSTQGNTNMPTDLVKNDDVATQLTSAFGITTTKEAQKVIGTVKENMESHIALKLEEQKVELTAKFDTEKAAAVETAKNEVTTELMKTQKDIFEACSTAKRPDLAAQYMAEGLSLEEAQEKLATDTAIEDENTNTSTNINPSSVATKNRTVSPVVAKINAQRKKRG